MTLSSTYILFLVFYILERLFELWLSKRHEKSLLKKGGQEVGHEHFFWMTCLHTSFLLACIFEFIFSTASPSRSMFFAFGFLVVVAQALRYLAITTLGERWTIKILILPDQPLVNHGIYHFVRHPNYWAVVLEIIALPMMWNSWPTALIFTGLNLFMLRVRIKSEEAALYHAC